MVWDVVSVDNGPLLGGRPVAVYDVSDIAGDADEWKGSTGEKSGTYEGQNEELILLVRTQRLPNHN